MVAARNTAKLISLCIEEMACIYGIKVVSLRNNMDECLKFLFPPPPVNHFRGTSAVWQDGQVVYKYATDKSLDVYMHELATIAAVPPQFAEQVGMVSAKSVPASAQVLKNAPPGVSESTLNVIEMPLIPGTEAYNIVNHAGFPQSAVSHAAISHCRRVVELGYANTDVKLENIIVSPTAVTFVDWGGICSLDAALVPHCTYVIPNRGRLTPLESMKVHLTMLIGEMGGLYLGDTPAGGCGVVLSWSDVEMARRFCEKQLDSDALALYLDFMGNFATGAIPTP